MVNLYKRKGPDVLVNTETLNSQSGGSIAMLPGGGFVVVWSDSSGLGTDTSGLGIKAQIFDANGDKVGSEFLVNTTTFADQFSSVVSALPSGRFFVSWVDASTSGGATGSFEIRGRLFEANGTPVGDDFILNTVTAADQLFPQITELSDGGFLVVWIDFSTFDEEDGNQGLKGQRFDASGTKVGTEFLINGEQTSPGTGGHAALALAGGGFAVAWSSLGARLQLFDAAGAKVGAEQLVNATDPGTITNVNINALGTGFIVTWAQQDVADEVVPRTYDLYAQRFDAAGSKLGDEFIVNSVTHGSQTAGDVHALPGGGFLIVWQGPAPGTDDLNLYGQIFDDNGVRVGGEFIVTTTTAGNQTSPKIEVLASGDIVITYNDSTGDASGSAVRMQILTLAGSAAPTDIALSDMTVSEVAVGNLPFATLSATLGTVNGTPTYTLVSDETGGAFRIDGDRLVVADNSKLDFETDPSVEVRIRVTDSNGASYEETLTLTVEDAVTETRYTAGDIVTVNASPTAGNVALGSAALASGGYVVVSSFTGMTYGLSIQIFDADGNKVGPERELDLSYWDTGFVGISGLPSGGFVIAYEGGPLNGGTPIRAQRFDAAGNEVGPELIVSAANADFVSQPTIATLSSGAFVVVWELTRHETGDVVANPGQIMARLYGADGTPMTDEFRVNTGIAGQQIFPNVAALPTGGFVVSWTDGSDIEFQRYDAAGNKVGNEFNIAAGLDLNDTNMTVLADGRLLLTWAQFVVEDDINIVRTLAQIITVGGAPVSAPFVVATMATAGIGYAALVTATADGGFVATWNSLAPDAESEDDYDSLVRFFDSGGRPVGDIVQLDGAAANFETAALATRLASGGIALTWTLSQLDESPASNDVLSRIISPPPSAPAGATPGPDVLEGTPGSDTIDGLAGNDIIYGLGSGDTLYGGADDDELWGGEGNDVLDGGTGVDVMYGGNGSDTYYVDNPGDLVVESSTGTSDRVITTVSYVLAEGSYVEVLEAAAGVFRLDGNSFRNTLIGNDTANVLDGAAGDDVLEGKGGNDTYIVNSQGDGIIEVAGGGFDAAYAYSSYGLDPNAQVEWLSTFDNSLTVTLNLTGSSIGQYLIGNQGDNGLDGRGGADFMQGFAGNDTYYVDHGNDAPVEVAGQGFDTVYTTISFGLAAGTSIEWLSVYSIAGTQAINLLGNEVGQYLIGNNGANTLDGAGGADIMIGYGGNDIYIVDSSADAVSEAANGGFDAVYTSASFALAAGSEVEWLTAATVASTDAINLSGNEFANYVLGNNGANVINGGAGSDILYGYGGADTFAFTTAPGAGNVDTITDFVAGTDRLALDDAIFTQIGGPGALNANAFVTGTAAADASDRIVYNSATGQLFYDADGNGAGAAVLFATLQGNPALTASDFQVI